MRRKSKVGACSKGESTADLIDLAFSWLLGSQISNKSFLKLLWIVQLKSIEKNSTYLGQRWNFKNCHQVIIKSGSCEPVSELKDGKTQICFRKVDNIKDWTCEIYIDNVYHWLLFKIVQSWLRARLLLTALKKNVSFFIHITIKLSWSLSCFPCHDVGEGLSSIVT